MIVVCGDALIDFLPSRSRKVAVATSLSVVDPAATSRQRLAG